MKKSLAILFAFFLVFAPVYSNAVLPVLAAAIGSNGGRVLVGNVIKKVAPQALNNAQKAMVGICKSNPTKCLGLGVGVGGLINAIVGDGWNIEVTNNDTTNNIDVDIYKLPPQQSHCYNVAKIYTSYSLAYGGQSATFLNAHNTHSSALAAAQSAAPAGYTAIKDNYADGMAKLTTAVNNLAAQDYTGKMPPVDTINIIRGGTTNVYYPPANQQADIYGYVVLKTYPCPVNKTYITNNDLNQYITNNNINDIDVLDIYNFDFSQYNNINIAGDTYNGTTINNDLAKSDPSETDKKVSADLKKKLDAKELSLDDVTDENCTKNEAGEYDKCGATEEPPVEEEPPTDEEPVESPIECDANGFYKKVCDWMDWTQKEPKPSTSESVDVKDVDAENSNKIDMAGECPAPYELSFNVLGYEQNHSISYEPLCGALVLLKPIFVGSGALSGMFILMGYSRASNTGVNG